jgi:hypothetical protein
LGDYLGDYFNDVLMVVNEALRFVPRPLTAAMMARLIPAAINPYSMAVAADWSAKKLASTRFKGYLLVKQARGSPGSMTGTLRPPLLKLNE